MMKLSYRLLFVASLLLLLLTACGGDDDKVSTKTFYDGAVSLAVRDGWGTESEEIGSGDYGHITVYSTKKIFEANSFDDLPDNTVYGGILVSAIQSPELADDPLGSLESYIELEGGLPDNPEFDDLEINGNPAGRIVGTEEQNGQTAYSYNVGIFYEEKIRVYIFLIGFKGEPSTFDPILEELVNSITIDAGKMASQLQ